jgi:hypothetical protein
MTHTPITFRPSFWRCYLSSVTPLLVGGLMGVLLVRVISNRPVFSLDSGFTVIAISAFFHLLLTPRMRDQLTITVTDGMVVRLAKEGDWGWPRIQFPIHTVDRERTCERPTVWQRLFGRSRRYLWSVDGRKIPIDYWAFTPEQITKLLTLIGCVEE